MLQTYQQYLKWSLKSSLSIFQRSYLWSLEKRATKQKHDVSVYNWVRIWIYKEELLLLYTG
ncbi:hypothetical protein L798_09914 [Zootermopsis nevadensis]|uniref:Uncharacterized protein n=1 Tax=Zootermopsis nevadensis TaxID=136037 RepID=A0A067RA89_ZOONE|nr:hypothetical protein L798_09914 [Zootermopsis nevadensis]